MADDAEGAESIAPESKSRSIRLLRTYASSQPVSRTSSPALGETSSSPSSILSLPPNSVSSPPPSPPQVVSLESPKHKDMSSLFGPPSGVDLDEFGMITPPSPRKTLSSLSAPESARSRLESQLEPSHSTITALQTQLSQLSSDLASYTRQLNEARNAEAASQRRANDLERAKNELQVENSGLLGQLEEVGKVVALSNKSAEEERISGGTEKKIRSLEGETRRKDEVARKERKVEKRNEEVEMLTSSLNLNDELLSNLRHQHALDLSTPHSRIRELKSSLFDAPDFSHILQHRITALEGDLAQRRRLSSPSRPDFDRRHSSSATGARPLRRVLAPRPVYEANLSAETRHKRKVSLSTLKARIESKRTATLNAMSTNSPRLLVTGRSRLPRSITEMNEYHIACEEATGHVQPR
ncbi:hypothetical protein M422DRAFT_250321 [Sphaerobolus stellatus SS14]|uniref:Unplaced genomic scaffold SPHSTscaffold_33, whole genome shotgun sequence n=1 Tax=Sphaerobolus stellatus (strain SS14) TaxID=990650 RepID=A0A0C9UTV9_SPHS4|nr:hypothetical protein M422DRAFT_250321 [Sphaerobolus stellatus SS14]